MDSSWIELSRGAARRMLVDPTDQELAQFDLQSKGMANCAKDRTHAFACVLKVFRERKCRIGSAPQRRSVSNLIPLWTIASEFNHCRHRYDRQVFLDLGMEHVDMYFDDGSNPSDDIVRQFIQMAETIIESRGQKVAVHCKAGLGRTGVLIGGQLSGSFASNTADILMLQLI